MPGWNTSSSEQPPTEKELYCPRNFYLGISIGPILTLVGLDLFIFHFLSDIQDYYKFKDTVPTPVIKVLKVELSVGEDNSEEVSVNYEYKTNGKIYTGDRASIYRGRDNFSSFHRDLYQRIKLFQENKSDELVCYVNPQNPAESVIDNSSRPSRLLAELVFSLIALGWGLNMCFGTLLNKKRYFKSD
tara:strand:- start:2491 stop:3051 length:561 start_codon:yes stop_codon:yes gene_type:complete